MKRILFDLVIVLVVVAISSCDSAAKNGIATDTEGIVSYGNGVYYFAYIKEDFGSNLSSFLEKNPSLKVNSMAANGSGSHGRDIGYFVVTEER